MTSGKRVIGGLGYEFVATAVSGLHKDGTALIIGANEGSVRNDPSFNLLNSSRMSHMDKVFVEPIPALHAKLVKNVARMRKAIAINYAIAANAEAPPYLRMWCYDHERAEVLRKEAARGGPSFLLPAFVTQICSLSRERLFATRDVLADRRIGLRPGASAAERERAQAAAIRKYEPLVRKVDVPALTVAALLQKHASRSPVRYLQIDCEGFDDKIVSMLPLGEAAQAGLPHRFRPTTIVFEHVLLGLERHIAAADRLRSFGYTLCLEGQNTFATLVGS